MRSSFKDGIVVDVQAEIVDGFLDGYRMKSHSSIVEGGGWITRQTVARPRARFFGFLSVIWLWFEVGHRLRRAAALDGN